MAVLPHFLRDYRPLRELEGWRAAGAARTPGDDDEHRHWTLRPYGKRAFSCLLSWSCDGRSAAVEVLAPTPEEAAWRALAEFDRCERRADGCPTASPSPRTG